MPKPTNSQNAPKNASTDTGTGGGKNLAKKIAKKAVKAAAQEGTAELAAGALAKKKTAARPIARQTTQSSGGKGVAKRGTGEWEAHPEYGRAGVLSGTGPADHTGSYTATHKYDFYDEDHQDKVEGKERKFYSLLANGGSGGTVGKSDPFLKGLLSDDTLTVQRPSHRRKKK